MPAAPDVPPPAGDGAADTGREVDSVLSRSLLRPTVAVWVAAVVTLLGSLVRGKVLAEAVGTAGVGVFAQVSNFVVLLSSVAALGLSNAAVKLISETGATGDDSRRRRLTSFIVFAPLCAGLLLVGVSAVFRSQISELLLGNRAYGGFIAFGSLAVPLNIVIGATQTLLQAQRRLVRLAVDSVLIATLTTATAAWLILPLGLTGGIVSIVATSAVGMFVMLFRERWIVRDALPIRSASRADVGQFASLGAASLVATALGVACDAGVRSLVVQTLGVAQNGLYQPVYLLSSQVFVQLNNGLSLVLLPSLAALLAVGNRSGALELVGRGVRLALVVLTPLILIVVATGDVLVRAAFSAEFAPSARILAVQMLGEVPRALTYAVGAVLIPAGMVRAFVTVGVAASVTYVLVSLLLLDALGLQALALSYIAQWVVALVVTGVFVRRAFGSTGLMQPNIRLAALSSALVGSAAAARLLVSEWAAAGLSLLGVVVWCVAVPTTQERLQARALVSRAFGRGR